MFGLSLVQDLAGNWLLATLFLLQHWLLVSETTLRFTKHLPSVGIVPFVVQEAGRGFVFAKVWSF
jgi:hypothetical protein